MSSLLCSTLNTRALPTGDMQYIRSDVPCKLTDDEVNWLRQNRITTVVDLREREEYERRPCRLEAEKGFLYYHMPVSGGGAVPESADAVAASYLQMIDEQMDRIIETIMHAESRVLFFCNAGKDRTGVVSAIILKKLGMDDCTIIADYMETKDNLSGFLQASIAEHPEVDPAAVIPNEENIKTVLRHVSA